MKQLESFLRQVKDIVVRHFGLVIAVIIGMFLGWWLINKFIDRFDHYLERKGTEIGIKQILSIGLLFTLRTLLIVIGAVIVALVTR